MGFLIISKEKIKIYIFNNPPQQPHHPTIPSYPFISIYWINGWQLILKLIVIDSIIKGLSFLFRFLFLIFLRFLLIFFIIIVIIFLFLLFLFFFLLFLCFLLLFWFGFFSGCFLVDDAFNVEFVDNWGCFFFFLLLLLFFSWCFLFLFFDFFDWNDLVKLHTKMETHVMGLFLTLFNGSFFTFIFFIACPVEGLDFGNSNFNEIISKFANFISSIHVDCNFIRNNKLYNNWNIYWWIQVVS